MDGHSCVCKWTTCMAGSLKGQKRASDSVINTGSCEPLGGCWELNLGLLKEQQVPLTADFLQTPFSLLFIDSIQKVYAYYIIGNDLPIILAVSLVILLFILFLVQMFWFHEISFDSHRTISCDIVFHPNIFESSYVLMYLSHFSLTISGRTLELFVKFLFLFMQVDRHVWCME